MRVIRPLYVRIIISVALAFGFFSAWIWLERVRIDVVGQPSMTGMIQSELERPFFEKLAEQTKLPLDIRYKTTDQLGYKDDHQLTMLRDGQLDLVSLRFLQNSAAEPTLLGIDPWGLGTTFATARSIANAYSPVLDQRLQEKFNAKLLGVWPFGPQVFFCRSPVLQITDIRGLRVRVGNKNFGPLVANFGAVPVIIPFEDVKAALAAGMIDCAITSAGSGYSAGWAQHSTHLFLLSTQIGVNGYVINLKLWNQFSKNQQAAFSAAFRHHIDGIWNRVENVHNEAVSCMTGGVCSHGTSLNLVKVEPSPRDVELLRATFKDTTLKDWTILCDGIYPGCAADWSARIQPLLAGDGANN